MIGNRENISILCMIYYRALNSHTTISSFITMAYDEVHFASTTIFFLLPFFSFHFLVAYKSEFCSRFYNKLMQMGNVESVLHFLVKLIDLNIENGSDDDVCHKIILLYQTY